ncbi:hypothetical protein ACLOJK_001098 [Asimina triloba]
MSLANELLLTVSPATLPPHKSHFPPNFKFRSTPTSRDLSFKARLLQNLATSPQQSLLPEHHHKSTRWRDAQGPINYCLSLLQHPAPGKPGIPDVRQVHAQIVKLGVFDLDGCNSVVNKLVVRYAKRPRLLDDARRLLDVFPERTASVYASLIRSYCRTERWEDVLSVFGLLVCDGVNPDKFLMPTIFKACSGLKALRIGEIVHAFVMKKRLDLDVFVGNSLIDMYAKCGDLESSRRAFDMMGDRDVVSWTALASAYADFGLLQEAREVFESMQASGLDADVISWNALISGFAQHGEIDMALHLLQEMKERGSKPGPNSWNGVISGCVQNGYFENALALFSEMCLYENPNAVTIASVISACSGLLAVCLGKELHSFAIKHELHKNIFVVGSLMDMYSKCGRSNYAERVFEEVENKNTALWNEMIAAYANEGKTEQARELLRLMQIDGLKPDLITYNTLLAVYARKGQRDEAFELFPEMARMGLKPNIISINVLISGFQQSGLNNYALALFRIIQLPKEMVLLDPKDNKPLPVEVLKIIEIGKGISQPHCEAWVPRV